MDLLDLWRGRLSVRKIGVYIQSLMRKPGRSTLLMAIDESASWDFDGYLLARISDALELSNYLFIKANSSEEDENDIPVPEPIPRPGEPEPEKKDAPKHEFATGQEVAAFFQQMNSL